MSANKPPNVGEQVEPPKLEQDLQKAIATQRNPVPEPGPRPTPGRMPLFRR
jgi:hypothetical protein